MFKTLYFKGTVQREKLGRIFFMWYSVVIDCPLLPSHHFLSYYAPLIRSMWSVRPMRDWFIHGSCRNYNFLSRAPHEMDTSYGITMDEGRERDNTSRRGGLPTLPGLYLSTIQPSQRGFFRVHTFVWRERVPVPEFSNCSGPTPGINSTELVDWFRVCSFVGYSSLHMRAEMIY